MNPHLVAKVAGAPIDSTAVPWARLHRAGRGYERKLLFAILDARQRGLDGVVATVDRDKSHGRDRLRELEADRSRHREKAPELPTALGVADPHAEAWLFDDPVAVRTVLRLAPDADMPNVRRIGSPKSELARLHRSSPRADEPIRGLLAEIAQAVEPARCQHARETGFGHFADDVRREIAPLAPQGA